ncbi:Chitin binding Peritrophin-A domain [Popillia japonica]|uniref:Chitin binding Peritrophin-A domain n=1 Tax=Popillia japonica TaxID=7064 RepID=A0AAW1MP87_POPJA
MTSIAANSNMPISSSTANVINSESTTMTSIAANSNMPISSSTEVGPEISTYSTTDKSLESTTSLNRVCIHVICPPYSEDPSTVTVFPHDTDCTKYCMCDSDRTPHVISCPDGLCMCDSDRTPHVISCPDGLYWNKERRICDFRSNVVCGPAHTTQVPNTESTTVTPIGESNNASISSTTNAEQEVTTNESSVTDTSTKDTTTGFTATAEDTEPPVSPGDVCGNINCPYPSVNVTYFPSTVCTKYCMCDWFGTAHVLDCPDGLHWNALLSTCDLTPCEDNLILHVI